MTALYSKEIIETIEIDPELRYEISDGWIKQSNFGFPWPHVIELTVNGETVGQFETVEDAKWAAYEHMAENSEL